MAPDAKVDYRERDFRPRPVGAARTTLARVTLGPLQTMRHAAAALAATLLLGLASNSAIAQWKWRDANGRITASDLAPPSSVPDRDILARPAEQRTAGGAPSPAPAASATPTSARPVVTVGTDPELEARRKRAADEQSLKKQQDAQREAAARAENCNRVRANLGALSQGGRIARANAQGEREILDDKGIAEELKRAQAAVASECR